MTQRINRNAASSGFTIVELLIVIVVIAILAAIVIVSYNGVVTRATESTMVNDLQSSNTTLGVDYQQNGSFPGSAGAANNGQGLKPSGSNVFTYSSNGSTFCLMVTNPRVSSVFHLTGSDSSIQSGSCPPSGATVATLAGNYFGYAESPSAVLLNSPSGITTYNSDLFFLDSSAPRVRKLTTGGTTSFIAGSSTSAYANGTGSAAQFNWPQAITADASGNLYIADTNNNRIRQVTSSGAVSLLAGTGSTSGIINGACTSATFNAPRGIVYSAGILYVADSNNHQIRAITLSGCTVTTLAGATTGGGYVDATGTAAKFLLPEGLAVDSSGNVFVADTNNNRIREVTSAGVVTTIAGDGTVGSADGLNMSAKFNAPRSVAVASDGTIYVADTGNNSIRKISGGSVTTIAGSGTAGNADGVGSASSFNVPTGLALVGNTLYVTDTGSNRIRALTNL